MDTNNKPNADTSAQNRPPRRNNRPGGKPNNGQPRGNNKPSNNKNNGLASSRGAAIRAQKRSLDDARKMVDLHGAAKPADPKERRANVVTDDFDKLKITFLGGQDSVGSKNMQVFEWQNDYIILDCGNNLGIDLPGINYSISDTTYLDSISHKKHHGYIISHGHLDHLGGLKHIVPNYPAPIYASRFTMGVIEKSFDDMPQGVEHYTPQTVIMNMDNHERLKLGPFMVELVRVTHSVPESALMIVDTPVGRIINTGDWRLDPEPLDEKPTDIKRLKELGDEGVLLLMSDSMSTAIEGRTPTESTLQKSFHDVIGNAEGRIFVAMFSSNMNRTQMVINAAVAAGRKVALDGRSMMAYAEIAVRQGILKVPKGTFLAMRDIAKIEDSKILVMCTGGQGEPNASLQRMAEGTHTHIKLHAGDTVVVSSYPIPGNEVRYEVIGNELSSKGVHLFRHPTHEVDGCGPLHVSGHAHRDEYREMLHLARPKYFLPIYAGHLNRKRYVEMAVEEGWDRKNLILAENGESYLFTNDSFEKGPEAPHGSILVDQTGAVVSGVVVKDRVILSEEGVVAIILTIDKKSGQLLTSPDIITRGFIYIRDSEELMNGLRIELRRAVQQRYKRIDLDRFKAELKDHVTHYLYDQTQRSPIVIPVVNVVTGGKSGGGDRSSNGNSKRPQLEADTAKTVEESKTPEDMAEEQKQRFEEMRARLLNQDPRTD